MRLYRIRDQGKIIGSGFSSENLAKAFLLQLMWIKIIKSTFLVNFSQEKEQFHRLAKLSKKYHNGKLSAVDWLDRLTFSEIERISQKEE